MRVNELMHFLNNCDQNAIVELTMQTKIDGRFTVVHRKPGECGELSLELEEDGDRVFVESSDPIQTEIDTMPMEKYYYKEEYNFRYGGYGGSISFVENGDVHCIRVDASDCMYFVELALNELGYDEAEDKNVLHYWDVSSKKMLTRVGSDMHV